MWIPNIDRKMQAELVLLRGLGIDRVSLTLRFLQVVQTEVLHT